VEANRDFFISGGTLPLDSESYIERSADHELLTNLSAGRYCYVLNSRQMGKSSLSVRTIARLNAQNILTAFVDLTQIGQNVQAEQWYAGLAAEVARAFGLTSQALKFYKSRAELSPMQRFFGVLREIVLEQVSEPIVIFIDEIDGTRNLPFDTDEFYAGIRECFNRRVHDQTSQRLTFCLIGVAVPNDLIRNPMMTPFNIGERIRLQDFNLEEIQRFASALGSNGDKLARRVHYWTNGQPFLTQSLCREIAADTRIQEERDVDSLVQRLYFGPKALETNLNLADVANRVLWDSDQSTDPDKYRADLLSAYERSWKGGSIPDDEANRISVVLKLSGLLRRQGARLVTRNRIYHHVFSRAWIEASMPNQELLRQVQSFRRGLIRGISLATVIAAMIAGSALLAFQARREAVDAKTALEYELYVSQMTSLSLLESSGDRAGMAAVLDRSQTNPNRGFEWNFWMGRLHDGVEEYTLDYTVPGKDENGILSQDGRQICIRDQLAHVVVVVNRQSKKVVATADLINSEITATKTGFLSIPGYDGAHRRDNPQPVTDVVTGRLVSQIGTPEYQIIGVAWRQQSDFIVIEEAKRNNIKDQIFSVWELATGRRVYRVPRPSEGINLGDPNSIMPFMSRNGRRFTYRKDAPAQNHLLPIEHLVICDAATDRILDDIPYPPRTSEIAMSESGRLMAYVDENRVLKLRDIDRRQDIYSLDTGVDAPIAVAISPDDKTLVCITSNGNATVREIPNGSLLAVLSNLKSIAPSGIGSLWVGSSSSVRLLNIPLQNRKNDGPRKMVAADGQGAIRILTLGAGSLERLSDPSLNPMPSFQLPKGAKSLTYNRLWCLAPEPNGLWQIESIGGASPSIQVPFAPKNLACGDGSSIFSILSKDGNWSGISGATGATLWTTPTANEYQGMWITRDSSHLIADTAAGYIVSIDPKTGKELRRSRAHHLYLSSLGFSRDGRQIVTGGGDGLTVLWDTDSLEKLQEFRGNAGQEISGASISPDGRRLATCDVVGDWQVWDTKTGIELTKIRAANFALRSLTFTADNMKLIAAGDNGFLRTWTGLDHDPTIKIPVPSESIKNLSFK